MQRSVGVYKQDVYLQPDLELWI